MFRGPTGFEDEDEPPLSGTNAPAFPPPPSGGHPQRPAMPKVASGRARPPTGFEDFDDAAVQPAPAFSAFPQPGQQAMPAFPPVSTNVRNSMDFTNYFGNKPPSDQPPVQSPAAPSTQEAAFPTAPLPGSWSAEPAPAEGDAPPAAHQVVSELQHEAPAPQNVPEETMPQQLELQHEAPSALPPQVASPQGAEVLENPEPSGGYGSYFGGGQQEPQQPPVEQPVAEQDAWGQDMTQQQQPVTEPVAEQDTWGQDMTEQQQQQDEEIVAAPQEVAIYGDSLGHMTSSPEDGDALSELRKLKSENSKLVEERGRRHSMRSVLAGVMEAARVAAESELERTRSDNLKLKSLLSESDSACQSLQSQLESLQTKLDLQSTADREAHDKKEQLAAESAAVLQSSLSQAEGACEALRSTLSETEAELSALREKQSTLAPAAEFNEVKAELAKALEKIGHSKTAVKLLNRTKREHMAQIKAGAASVQRLEAELAALQDQATEREASAAQEAARITELTEANKSMETRVRVCAHIYQNSPYVTRVHQTHPLIRAVSTPREWRCRECVELPTSLVA